MHISWLVNEVHGGWSPLSTRLGGTEEGIVEWSKRLVKRGHDVTVYHNGEHGSFDGVSYRDRSSYIPTGGVCLNVKCPDQVPMERTWYITTETDATRHDLSQFEAVIWPSQWAVNNIPVNNRTIVLPYGYDDTKIFLGTKIPKTVLYASSPDRGLDTLLNVWPEVVIAEPDAQLLVTYGATLPKVLPNSLFLGEVTNDEMDDLYRSSDIWCHPASGGELYGISGVKAQAAGCWPVYFPTMALAETVRFGTPTNQEWLAQDLIEALAHHPKPPKLTFPTWDSTTDQLEQILQS